MSEEEFGRITEEGKMWSAEEDVKWCANVALGAGGVVILGGVIFAGYAESMAVKSYTIIAALIFGVMFIAVGAISHWWVRRQIKRTTISRPGGGG
jgi:ABC-type uncharacterized transport system permease subunit